jgi:hypothetical protein
MIRRTKITLLVGVTLVIAGVGTGVAFGQSAETPPRTPSPPYSDSPSVTPAPPYSDSPSPTPSPSDGDPPSPTSPTPVWQLNSPEAMHPA